jgi:predicted PurR-regulated permease PerM
MAEPSPSAMTPPPGGGDADTAPRWQGPALGDVVFGRRAGREPSVRSILRVIVTVVGSALALYIVYRLRTPISYLLFATFIAVALSAPVAWLSQRMPKGLAITIVYLAVVLVPIGVGAILIPPLVRAAADLVGNFPSYVDDLKQTVSENDTLQNLNDNFDVTTKLEEFATNAASKLDDVASVLADVGAGIVGSVFAGVTILIMSLFMVSRGGKWIDMALSTRPPREAEVIKRALDNMSVAVGAYVGGAILQSLIAGVVTFIVLSILGVPAPLALAVVVAVLDLIPLVGATLGAILVGIVTLFVDFPSVTIIWIVWAILYQQFENYVIQPRIQGRMVQLDPFIIVIAALFGGTLIGIVGALVAIPVAGAAQIGVREFITYRREALLAQREEDEAAGIDGPPGNGDPPGGEEPPDGGEPPDSGSGSGPEGEPAPA